MRFKGLGLPVCGQGVNTRVRQCTVWAQSAQEHQHTARTTRRPGLPNGRRLSKRVPMDMLSRVCQSSPLSQAANNMCRDQPVQAQPHYMRFPSIEFRSLALNPLAKAGLYPIPDKGTWNRHKVDLAHLVLMLAAGDYKEYDDKMSAVVEAALERETFNLRKSMRDPNATDEEKEKCEKKYDIRRTKVRGQFEAWCQATVKAPNFQLLRPVLEKVLEIEPAPQIDNKRDGQHTEIFISSLLERELPPGWTMHTQCRIVAVDDEPFRNVKMIKGEADVVLADCQGIVQAILEVKTAKGNPYLALYEDVQRFRNMTERVRGRLVAFSPGHGVPNPPVPPPAGTQGGTGSGSFAVDSSGQSIVTLRFSKNVKPIYVLGNNVSAEDLGPVVQSARSKLITMEFGRILSTQIDAWRDVNVVEINREAAILQVPPSSFPECESTVRRYFENLQTCDIFMVQTV